MTHGFWFRFCMLSCWHRSTYQRSVVGKCYLSSPTNLECLETFLARTGLLLRLRSVHIVYDLNGRKRLYLCAAVAYANLFFIRTSLSEHERLIYDTFLIVTKSREKSKNSCDSSHKYCHTCSFFMGMVCVCFLIMIWAHMWHVTTVKCDKVSKSKDNSNQIICANGY